MRILVVAAGLLSMTLWAEPAFACSCAGPSAPPAGFVAPPLAESYRLWLDSHDGVVFRGTAIRWTDSGDGGTWVAFRVERQWKGVRAAGITIFVPRICGGGYPPGALSL